MFSGLVADAGVGTRYRLRLDRGAYPDPASRYQPEGPHGPSQVVDPSTFSWTDAEWRGRPPDEYVIYELHLGTFTRGGTWRSAMAELPALVELGITVLEIMPIADFTGGFGWGYDGVNLFAPSRLYGTPDDARAFIDRAHALGLMVILDVVYNHFGPDGNHLNAFSGDYVSAAHHSEWGPTFNFDGPNAHRVREYVTTNARYWSDEYHFDGLRLDATQQIIDGSPRHVIADIVASAREAAPGRTLFLVGENEPQDSHLLRPVAQGGCGLDALWNDDFHHSAFVAATGRSEAYFLDYRGAPQEFISAFKHGFLYQGQRYWWQSKRRGRPALDIDARRFVVFLENHDQVANSLRGQRLHSQSHPGTFRALTALLLLSPGIPLLFQGQEFGSSAPFLYFADHEEELARMVAAGRRDFLRQFPTIADGDNSKLLATPHDRAVFEGCRLESTERNTGAPLYRLHSDLLRIRRTDATLHNPSGIDGAVLSPDAFLIRFFGPAGGDRLLIVNLGVETLLRCAPEPLLAPLEDQGWRIQWSSEATEYGGHGSAPLETTEGWRLPGRAAVLLEPDSHHEPFRVGTTLAPN